MQLLGIHEKGEILTVSGKSKIKAAQYASRIARSIAGKSVYRKKLPGEFGGAMVYVTPRSDIRILAPGFNRTASDLLQVASLYVEKGDCVWDIGSNLGIFSFCAAWKAGPEGSVHTLEADPFFAELQNRTVRKLPGGYAPVIPLCAAVSDKTQILDLSIPQKGCSRNHLAVVEGNDAGESEARKQVVSVTADFLLQYWPKPDFVKVDIEGAEILFLLGATKLLKDVRPQMYIEVSQSNSELTTQILSSLNYNFFTISSSGSEQPIERLSFNSIARSAERP